MQLGEQVHGLMMGPEWRFITADAHDVHLAVNRHDPLARLVGTPDGRVAVARFIEKAAIGDVSEDDMERPIDDRGGAWLLVFKPTRNGEDWRGEPDMSIVQLLQARDVHARRRGVNARELLDQFENMQRVQQDRAHEDLRERMRATAEENIHGWARKFRIPWRPSRIIVPSGVARGRNRL